MYGRDVTADFVQATAYWTLAPGEGVLRDERLREPGPDEALVRALHSGISRGTELLVNSGGVPSEVADTMRAPFQEGDLPGPVKYGYLSVGVVERGPQDLVDRDVFCLFPHQDRYVVPAAALTPLPPGVPARRATLAGAAETAVNALWDAAPRLGDRVAVVGAGMIGCAVAALLRTFPLQRLQLVDVDPGRESVASALGVELVHPTAAADGCDLVVHASGSSAGLQRSLELLGDEGEVIELSWYGTRDVTVAARVGVPLPTADGPRESGGSGGGGASRSAYPSRAAVARTGTAARRRLRRADHRVEPVRRAAGHDAPDGLG